MNDPVVARLRTLVGAEQVVTDPVALREASVDRFKKYPSAHGIHDGPFPAAIVFARSTDDVARVLAYADGEGLNVVPRTGRTSTEGGLETTVPDSIVLDGSRMAEIVSIDAHDMQATVQCGVRLQVLEDRLREQGLTTGHSPQSKPLAQLGGLVATRSIGQLSTLYGAIEDLVVGLEAVLPDGTVCRIKNVPRRAAGPDIRHLVIGNEGALAFVTEVTVKVFRHRPGTERYQGFLVDDVRTGVAALREVIVEGYRPAVCRLYSPDDAAQHFGNATQGRWLLVFVSEGPAGIVAATAAGIEQVLAGHRHDPFDSVRLRGWFAGLNWGPDRIDAERAAMVETRSLGYTTEVSASWSKVADLYESVVRRIEEDYPYAGDLTLLGAHSSHSYQTGTNLYFVYDYRIDCEPREEIEKYHKPLNAIIVEEALRVGGSMVHHHGIGKYRTAWTRQEHGSAYPLLARVKTALDPRGTMNRGTIFPAG